MHLLQAGFGFPIKGTLNSPILGNALLICGGTLQKGILNTCRVLPGRIGKMPKKVIVRMSLVAVLLGVWVVI